MVEVPHTKVSHYNQPELLSTCARLVSVELLAGTTYELEKLNLAFLPLYQCCILYL